MTTIFVLFADAITRTTHIRAFDKSDNKNLKGFEILSEFKNLSDAQLLKLQYDEGAIK